MEEIVTIEDVYTALDALVPELRKQGHELLANIIYHRMHQVAWTSGSELLRELQNVLTDALQPESDEYAPEFKIELEKLLNAVGQLVG